MRRRWPARLIFAIIAFSLAIMAAPASAAPHAPGATASRGPQYHGVVCRTVHSNIHHKTGVICAAISIKHSHRHRVIRAVALFKSNSGKLTRVSVRQLNLYVSGKKVRSDSYTSAIPHAIPGNMWDGAVAPARSGVFHACMYWPDGSRACTSSPLFSKTVGVSV
jgi:hypothetical protein